MSKAQNIMFARKTTSPSWSRECAELLLHPEMPSLGATHDHTKPVVQPREARTPDAVKIGDLIRAARASLPDEADNDEWCRFCGEGASEVNALVCTRDIDADCEDEDNLHICDECVGKFVKAIALACAKPLSCNFCRKTSSEVKKLIQAPEVYNPTGLVPYICDECVGECVKVIEGRSPSPSPSPSSAPNITMLLLWLHTALSDPRTDVVRAIAGAQGASVREIIDQLKAAHDEYREGRY